MCEILLCFGKLPQFQIHMHSHKLKTETQNESKKQKQMTEDETIAQQNFDIYKCLVFIYMYIDADQNLCICTDERYVANRFFVCIGWFVPSVCAYIGRSVSLALLASCKTYKYFGTQTADVLTVLLTGYSILYLWDRNECLCMGVVVHW